MRWFFSCWFLGERVLAQGCAECETMGYVSAQKILKVMESELF